MLRLGTYVDCACSRIPRMVAVWLRSGTHARLTAIRRAASYWNRARSRSRPMISWATPVNFRPKRALRIIRLHTDPIYLKASSVQDLKTILSKALVASQRSIMRCCCSPQSFGTFSVLTCIASTVIESISPSESGSLRIRPLLGDRSGRSFRLH